MEFQLHPYLRIFVVLLAFSTGPVILAQDITASPSIKEKQLKELYGIEKLQALNEISQFYQIQGDRKAIRYAKQASSMAEKLLKKGNSDSTNAAIAHAFETMAHLNFERKKYFEFAKNTEKLKEVQGFLNDTLLDKTVLNFEIKIDSLYNLGEVKTGFINRTLSNLKIGKTLRDETTDIKIKAQLNQARTKEKNQKFLAAIEHYEEAINLYRNKGAQSEITELQIRIASLYDSLRMFDKSEDYLENVIQGQELNTQTSDVPIVASNLSDTESRDSLLAIGEDYQELAKKFEGEGDFKRSLQYYELYQKVTQKLFEDSIRTRTESQLRENEITLLTQQKNIATLNLEKSKVENERQVQLKRTYLIIGLLALISTVIGYVLYLSKRKKHKKLTTAYQHLDVANSKLQKAEKRITQLLQEQVSAPVANALLKSNENNEGRARNVCILFLDIRGFTPLAQKLSAKELIAFQNEAFGPMLDSIQKHQGIVNQLLGDGFMATFGIASNETNHCQQAYLAAIEILQELKKRITNEEIQGFEVGMGLHAGNVVVGNVGNKKRKQFSITGNPVIISSRLEQLNKTYKSKLILSEAVFEQIKTEIKPKDFKMDTVRVKGRDENMSIYILKT